MESGKHYGHLGQGLVADFHKALDIPIADEPGLRRVELRCGLLAEECKETIEAAEVGNLIEAIDGLCDLMYAVYGAALEWGLDLAPFFAEVHRSNMSKLPGPLKAQKGEGYSPPDLGRVLREQMLSV